MTENTLLHFISVALCLVWLTMFYKILKPVLRRKEAGRIYCSEKQPTPFYITILCFTDMP